MKPKSIWRTIGASLTALTLIAFPTSSVLADQVEIPEFTQTGHHPNTIYLSITTATSGAIIFYTRSLWPYGPPPYPTHNGSTPINCQVYYGPLGVGNGQLSYFMAVAYKEGMTDSGDYWEVDNTGL
ncbi:MAG TPA: hypothetical protein VJU77_08230 [Chthoniobacterales bacterium]|nr:hypothetical protein [Chthoniobacterales bacterium]